MLPAGWPARLLLLSLGSFFLFVWPAVPAEAEVTWASNYQAALEQARAEQKFVMVDFYTHWCGWCRVLDARTYTDDGVSRLTDRMVSVKVNAEADRALARRYGVRSYPTIVFLNPDESARLTIRGFRPPDRFIPVLEEVLRIDSERFALTNQMRANPEDGDLRLTFAHLLARGGDLSGAVAQIDTLLEAGGLDDEARASYELERLVLLERAGTSDSSTRKALEKWVKKRKKHQRIVEGKFYLARLEEREGRAKDAQKLYRDVVKAQPGSWMAETARDRLASD